MTAVATAAAPPSPAASPAKSKSAKAYTQRVGDYRYCEADVLGEGAYGSVYKAYDTRHRSPPDAPHTAPLASRGAAGDDDDALPRELRGCRVVALKKLSSTKAEDGLAAATLREIAILKELANPLPAELRPGALSRLGGRAPYAANAELTLSSTPGVTGSSSVVQAPHPPPPVPHRQQSRRGSRGSDASLMPSPPLMPFLPSYGGEHLDPLVALGRRFVLDVYSVAMTPKSSTAYVALEYCEGGDAWHHLRTVPERRLKDPRILRRWVREMVLGIAYMHAKNISHRDLKTLNIMLKRRAARTPPPPPLHKGGDGGAARYSDAGDEFTVKVADFGLSRVEDIPVKKYVHEAVTLWYRSPDVLLGNTNYSYSADAWSLGCMILEIAGGTAPFQGKDEADQLKRICTRLGGPHAADLPVLGRYPRSATYADTLASLAAVADPHGQRAAAAALPETAHRLSAYSFAVHSSDDAALQEQIATNRASIRALLRNRGDAVAVLGEEGVDLVARLLVFDPRRRLTVLDATRHPYIAACDGNGVDEAELSSAPSDVAAEGDESEGEAQDAPGAVAGSSGAVAIPAPPPPQGGSGSGSARAEAAPRGGVTFRRRSGPAVRRAAASQPITAPRNTTATAGHSDGAGRGRGGSGGVSLPALGVATPRGGPSALAPSRPQPRGPPAGANGHKSPAKANGHHPHRSAGSGDK